MDYYEKLLNAVRESRFSIEEISGLTHIPEIILYKIFSGEEKPGDAGCERIATVLGCAPQEIFPYYNPEDDDD